VLTLHVSSIYGELAGGARSFARVGNGSGRCENVQIQYCSLCSSGLSIYRMTRPNCHLRHGADSGTGWNRFSIGRHAGGSNHQYTLRRGSLARVDIAFKLIHEEMAAESQSGGGQSGSGQSCGNQSGGRREWWEVQRDLRLK
jgi:hypothetical protein